MLENNYTVANTTTENKKRNQFKMMMKVFKYEAKNLQRMVLPLYGALVILGLVIGLGLPKVSVNNKEDANVAIQMYENNQTDYNGLVSLLSYTIDVNNQPISEAVSEINEVILILFALLFPLTVIASFVAIAFFIDKRQKVSMIGDEALLNFTLPVTIGEHIAGRFLCYIVTFLVWMIIVCLTSALQLIKIINPITVKLFIISIKESYLGGGIFSSLGGLLLTVISFVLAFYMLIISFGYLDHAKNMLFEKKMPVVQFIIMLTLVVLWLCLMGKMGNNINKELGLFAHWPIIIVNLLLTAINITFTVIVYKKRINIE